MKKVLMVCLGNICRSPMAQGVLEQKAKDAGINIQVDSAGTASYHVGEMPDERAIVCMKKKGIDISKQRARQFTANNFITFDYILVMDMENNKNVVRLTKDDLHKQKVIPVMNFLYPNEGMSVPDPYYGNDAGFENVYNLLNAAFDVFIEKMQYER